MTSFARPAVTGAFAALVVAALSLTGCTSATSSSCVNGACTVSLSGAGSSTELGPNDVAVALEAADGATATFSVAGESASCTASQSLTVAGYAVTCDEVGDDALTLSIQV